ncbi:MAG TPA: type II toxin-antitoxin system VapC family toxin [Acidimicrobiales bacterium]|jgi:predicted nucleic acid-binding protein|nr:type II toxin-antitoxin system VapC family toxin [Acidimicrobiales bacterium]
MRATYVDSSAIVKLAVGEAESGALRRHLQQRRPLISSALARTEVLRALLPSGPTALIRGRQVLATMDLVRVNEQILNAAGALPPADLRSLDAIHLATARQLGRDVNQLVTYDERMADAARGTGFNVATPRPAGRLSW